MPELPEVEVTRLGIASVLTGRRIQGLVVRDGRLRQPISPDLPMRIIGQRIRACRRRAKYLILELESGALLLHLGMSGSLSTPLAGTPARTHDHVDLVLDNGHCLRLHDPRRFGLLLFCEDWPDHPLIRSLGPEPLEKDFDGDYLHARAAGHRLPVKNFIMDSRVVVGVGNIYANESLFASRIDPRRAAGAISRERYRRLAATIRTVLSEAITVGGTTLRDFSGPGGELGYFRLSLAVYGREGAPCPSCAAPLRSARIGGRSTYFCPRCQR